MKIGQVPFGLALALAGAPASAGVFADDLTRCTVASTTAADRTALMRWTFVVAATNPAFEDLISITTEERARSDRGAADVFNRLLLHDCRRQTIDAVRNEGASALESAFQNLGEYAGREMMNGPESNQAMERFAALLDGPGLEALGREAGVSRSTGAAQRQ